ncbi:MAG: hypothetical protein MUO23_15105, partial [Anaerolineales bacterium]|nr:hypothetical protein [Anaerolineales bacterium]
MTASQAFLKGIMLTIFSAPKPFTNPHISLIQGNAIRSWLGLGAEVNVLVVGDEPGLAEAADGLQVRWISGVERNSHGTPRLDSIFHLARTASSQPLMAYVNADILLLPDLVEAARAVQAECADFLMVGQRWDLGVANLLEGGEAGQRVLRDRVAREGVLHPAGGSDYFVFPRQCFADLPAFAIGRSGWDNWMIYHARRNRWPVVD